MSWLAGRGLLRSLLDARSAAEIEADVQAEIEHHLACKERELVEQGLTPEAARGAALARFGDVDSAREACLRIQTGERIMLQRIHLAVTVLLFVAVLVLAWSARRSNLSAADVARALRAEMAEREAAARQPVEHVIVEVGDRLQLVDEYNPDAVHGTVTVAEDGKIPVPEVGWVFVAGKTREDVEQELTDVLKPYFLDSKVRVIVLKMSANELGPVLFEAF